MTITAQVSHYPLRQPSIGPAIRETVRVFRDHGLGPRVGVMSTVICGEEQAVFAALQAAFHQAAAQGYVVMTVTLTNAAPTPQDLDQWQAGGGR